MHKHHADRNRDWDRRVDTDSDWGQARSRSGHGEFRRFRHEPYKRQGANDRRTWFEEPADV